MLKEIAVPTISTAKDIYGMIYIIVDYRVGIFLEIPHTNYIVQCNTVPNSNTIANMYMYIRI